MKKLIGITVVVTAIALLLTPTQVWAKTDLSRLNKVEDISLFENDNEARFVVRLKKPMENGYKASQIKLFEKSMQVDIKGAFIAPSKKEYPLDSLFIKRAAAFQMTPTSVRLRFFTTEDGRKYRDKVSLSTNGDLLLIAIKKPEAPIAKKGEAEDGLANLIAKAAKQKSISSVKTEKAPAVLEAAIQEDKKTIDPLPWTAPKAKMTPKPEVAPKKKKIEPQANKIFSGAMKALATPVEAAEPEKTSFTNSGKGKRGFLKYEGTDTSAAPDLSGAAMKMVAALAFTLGLFLVGAWAFKKFMNRFEKAQGNSGALITTLASASVGPKQRVVVIDLAGETLALGMTDESISLLTVIEDEESIGRLRSFGKYSKPGSGDAALLGAIMGGSGKGGSAIVKPSGGGRLLGKVFGAFRVGRVKTEKRPRALVDEKDLETFAGRLARAVDDGADDRVSFGGVDLKPSREELLKEVTSAIRGANKKLSIA